MLLTIKDPDERDFYEIEAASEGWSLPELKRQKASCLYERLALSRDKAGVKRLAEKGQIITRPEDVLKEPLILEFLGLDEKATAQPGIDACILQQRCAEDDPGETAGGGLNVGEGRRRRHQETPSRAGRLERSRIWATGLPGNPPPGPAMPVTERPISVPSARRTPRAISRAVGSLTAP